MEKPYNPFTSANKLDEDVPNLSRMSALNSSQQNRLCASMIKTSASMQCQCEQRFSCGDSCRNTPYYRQKQIIEELIAKERK